MHTFVLGLEQTSVLGRKPKGVLICTLRITLKKSDLPLVEVEAA
jgi:hypothetical protein